MKRSFVRLLLPVLILGAAGLACSRGVQRDSQEPTATPSAGSSGELDGAADQVESLLDELATENSQADPLEDITVEAVEQTPAPDVAPAETPPPTPTLDLAPTEPAESLSPESEEMLSTLEALVGELEGLNADVDPLDDLP
jgi:outer membrane biosynthesis protein TonB